MRISGFDEQFWLKNLLNFNLHKVFCEILYTIHKDKKYHCIYAEKELQYI